MRPLVTRTSRRDRKCFTSRVEASPEGWPRSSAEKSSESSWACLRERAAAALMVKWRRQSPSCESEPGRRQRLPLEKRWWQRDGSRSVLTTDGRRVELSGMVFIVSSVGGYPHMKMHEYQNKGVTKKAFRKCKKRKE